MGTNIVPHRVITTIDVGYSPCGIAAAADRVYVINSGWAGEDSPHRPSMSVISRASNSVVATVDVGNHPSCVAVAPGVGHVYVGSTEPGKLSELDNTTHTAVITINIAEPPGQLVVAADRLYVTSGATLWEIDMAAGSIVARVPLYSSLGGLAIGPDRVYISGAEGSFSGLQWRGLIILDRTTLSTISRIWFDNVPHEPIWAARRLYMSGGAGEVLVLDQSAQLVTTIRTGIDQWIAGMAATLDGSRIYVTSAESGSVSVIDTTTNTVTATIDVGGSASDIAVAPDGSRIYVMHRTVRGTVTVIEAVLPLRYLEVKVTAGSAPAWLVTRYAVACTYQTLNGTRPCGNGSFGPEGGIVEGQLSDEGGSFPATIDVTVTIDFASETGLAGFVKHFGLEVTPTGVQFLFEPNQELQKTLLVFELRPPPLATDYLLLRWKHTIGASAVTAGQKTLSGEELQKLPFAQYEIVFVPDPVAAQDFNLDIMGRYQDKPLTRFTQAFQLSDSAVVLSAQQSSPGSNYKLVAS